jgi:hypothetical protein
MDESLSSVLRFNPRIWWDPVPWPLLNDVFQKPELAALARIHLQLQKDQLQAQLKALDSMEKALPRG